MQLKGISYNPKTGDVCRNGKPLTTTDPRGYKQSKINGKTMRLHRVAWYLTYGYWPKEIDHINGDKGDNRLFNLRECTRSTNMLNRPAQSNNKLGIKGVYWLKHANQYEVYHRGKRIGLCKTLEEAVKRRDDHVLGS